MVLSVLIPHEWSVPAAMVLKVPAGASLFPAPLSPQQVMVSSVLIPHEWKLPAVMVLKVPAGVSLQSLS